MIVQDIRFGVRTLARKPGFTLVAVLTLALGIAATTALFSVVNSVLLQPLPYAQPERLVMLFEKSFPRNRERNVVCPANFLAWVDESRSFERLAAVAPAPIHLTGVENPEELSGIRVSADYFPILGVAPTLGRVFTPEEDQRGHNRVVVLSHRLWQRRFGGDPSVIGETMELGGFAHTILGVMPADFRNVSIQFRFGSRADLWLPIAFAAEARNWTGRYLAVLGSLESDISLTNAQAEMDTIAARLAETHPDRNKGWGVNVVPLQEQTVENVRPALLVLLGAVALVLLIACVNVANLLLARATERRREVAIRTSLGAGRARIVRQLLIESILLAVLGGSLGLGLAYFGTEALVQTLPDSARLPRQDEVRVDVWVLAFACGISMLSGILFGLVPALAASKTQLTETLKEGGARAGAGLRGLRLKNVLVVSEIALALVLLTGSGLLIRSFVAMSRVDSGVNPENVLTARLMLPSSRYPETHQQINFFNELFERLQSVPGVRSAGGINWLPFSGLRSATSFWPADRPEPPTDEKAVADIRIVSPEYFSTLKIPLLKGRLFNEQDHSEAPNALIVNQSMVERYFPNEDPMGKRLVYSWGDPISGEIVGVVGDVRHEGLVNDPRQAIYLPNAQLEQSFLHLVVRTETDPNALVPTLSRELRALDPDLPLADLRTLDEILTSSVSSRRLQMNALGLFAAIATALAAIGIYGVISYTVSQRFHEMGIRMALGAKPTDVMSLVVKRGTLLTMVGASLGIVLALATTRLLSSLLFGVTTTDVTTFISTPLLLAGVALLACLIPAYRAMKADPVDALRHE
jgi:putative ABC transport system permease protein